MNPDIDDSGKVKSLTSPEMLSEQSKGEVSKTPKTFMEMNERYLKFCCYPYSTGGARIVVTGDDLEWLIKHGIQLETELAEAQRELKELNGLLSRGLKGCCNYDNWFTYSERDRRATFEFGSAYFELSFEDFQLVIKELYKQPKRTSSDEPTN